MTLTNSSASFVCWSVVRWSIRKKRMQCGFLPASSNGSDGDRRIGESSAGYGNRPCNAIITWLHNTQRERKRKTKTVKGRNNSMSSIWLATCRLDLIQFCFGIFFSLKHETFLEEYFKKTTHTVGSEKGTTALYLSRKNWNKKAP